MVIVLFILWPEKPQVNQKFITRAFLQETKMILSCTYKKVFKMPDRKLYQ